MSFVGKLARGLATGLGGYYGKVAEQQDEERKSQILMDRERALAQINHDYRMEESHAASLDTRDTYDHKVEADVAGELATIPAKERSKIRTARAEHQLSLEEFMAKQPLELQHDLTVEQMRQRYETYRTKLVQDRTDRRQDDDQQHYIDTHPLGEVQNERGEPTYVFGQGARTRTVTARGGRPVSTKAASSDDALLLGSDPAPTGIAPRAAPQVQAPAQDAEAQGNWSRLVAESASHPNYKNMSAEDRYNALVPLAQTLQSKGVKIMIPPPLNGGR